MLNFVLIKSINCNIVLGCNIILYIGSFIKLLEIGKLKQKCKHIFNSERHITDIHIHVYVSLLWWFWVNKQSQTLKAIKEMIMRGPPPPKKKKIGIKRERERKSMFVLLPIKQKRFSWNYNLGQCFPPRALAMLLRIVFRSLSESHACIFPLGKRFSSCLWKQIGWGGSKVYNTGWMFITWQVQVLYLN